MKTHKIIFNQDQSERLDKFLTGLGLFKRSYIQQLISQNLISVNKKNVIKNGFKLKNGDLIVIDESSYVSNSKINLIPWEKSNIIKVIKESEDYLILNKPTGVVVHPGINNWEKTLANALVAEYKDLDILIENRPGIVHRLDKDTSGVIIISKNAKFTDFIQKQFQQKTIKKVYIAFLKGRLSYSNGIIDAPVGKNLNNVKKLVIDGNNAKDAITKFKVLKRYDDFSLVAFYPQTGRTHQLRVHADYIKNPVLNDPIYNSDFNEDPSNTFGQYLHAYKISFKDFEGNEKTFKSDIPKEFYQMEPNLDKILSEMEL